MADDMEGRMQHPPKGVLESLLPRFIGYFLLGNSLEPCKERRQRSLQKHRLLVARGSLPNSARCRTSWHFPQCFHLRISMCLTFLRSMAWHRHCLNPLDAVPL